MRRLSFLVLSVCAQVAVAQDPSYWVLVHTGDRAAKNRILSQHQYRKALEVATELGYEVVVEKEIAYFFPVPAWSMTGPKIMADILDESIDGSGDKTLRLSELDSQKAEHLRRFFSKVNVGGDLGQRAKNTDLKSVTVQRTVDVHVRIAGKEVTVPFSYRDIFAATGGLAPRANSDEESSGANAAASAGSSPPVKIREELYGLGTESFAMNVSSPVSADLFEKILVRATNLLKNKREEDLASLSTKLEEAFYELFENGTMSSLQNGRVVPFIGLSDGLKATLLKTAQRIPQAFGLTDGTVEAMMDTAMISIPRDGLRVFVNFQLDGTVPASDGTPIRYAVGYEVLNVAGG